MHSEAILDVTRAFLRASLPSEFAAVTTGPIHELESLCRRFDSDYGSVKRTVEIHEMAPVIEGDRATVRVNATFHFSVEKTGQRWDRASEATVHLSRTTAGWRVENFKDNRRSQVSGVFLEPAGGHEFQGVTIAPVAAELSHMGLLIVFQVFNRTDEPLELVFTRLRHKACRVMATTPERPHVAPPGVTTTSFAIFPIALPVETPKLRLEFGVLGARTSTGYNVALDVGLHSTKLDPPKTKRWRGRRTNLPLATRFGLGAVAVAAFFGSLTLLPNATTTPVRSGAPASAREASDTFADALMRNDPAALELLSPHAPRRRKLEASLRESLAKVPTVRLGKPRVHFYPVDAASNAPSAEMSYPLAGARCLSGKSAVEGWLEVYVDRAGG
ncbi:MAG: hypothetical protein ACRDJT_07025 [Actinomycetota bacterium]